MGRRREMESVIYLSTLKLICALKKRHFDFEPFAISMKWMSVDDDVPVSVMTANQR